MSKCSPKGRECIEKEANRNFNCSLSCDGIYADIQFMEEHILMDFRGKIENTTDKVQRKGELLNKEKFANMIKKYKAYKRNFVKMFRYNAGAGSSSYGNVISFL